MTKTAATEAIQQMPDEFALELVERLKFMEIMERGRQQYHKGKTLTHEEVMKRLESKSRFPIESYTNYPMKTLF